MKRILFALSMALAYPVGIQAQTPTTDLQALPSYEDFVGDADYYGAELSPTGRFVSGIRRLDEGLIFLIVDLNHDLDVKTINLGGFFPIWSEWVTDDRLLIKVRGFTDLKKRNKILSREEVFDPNYKGAVVPFERLVAIDRDGSKPLTLLSDRRDFKNSFFNANVVDFLRDDPDHILMAAQMSGDLDLFKVNVSSGEYERIALGTDNTFSWYVDRNGEPAFRFNTNRRRTTVYVYAREDRENGSIKWRKIRTIRLNQDNPQRDAATEFKPLYPGPTETTFYVAARPEGAKTTGIYLYNFEEDEFLETIKTDPEFDIENAFFSEDTGEYLGSYYFRDRITHAFTDTKLQANLDGIQVWFGENINVLPVDTSHDGDTWLIKSIGPTDPGTFHIFDVETAQIRAIGAAFINLGKKTFADAEVVRYAARDGMEISGYLTRPVGLPEGEIPPLIMMPHGGPEVRDYLSFDFNAQLLAAYGYQVFQPNFRGSSGYGEDFAKAGYRQWGKAMQTDVEDGLNHLVEAGLVDPSKVCIFGASYGGYVAQLALTQTPDIYRCAISKAGPSDLLGMLKYERQEEGRDSETYQYWIDQIGHPKDDEDDIRAISPINLVEQAKHPLLLVHGENDSVVPPDQSEEMDEAMRKAGKSVRFVMLTNSGHSYYGKGEEKRYYSEILSFLRENLPSSRNAPVAMESADGE